MSDSWHGDEKYDLGSLIRLSCRIDINTSDAEIMTERLEEVYKTGNDTLKELIRPQLKIMKAWTDAENVLIDNVKDTCLIIAVIKAIENGTIQLEPSLKENTITANINNQEEIRKWNYIQVLKFIVKMKIQIKI